MKLWKLRCLDKYNIFKAKGRNTANESPQVTHVQGKKPWPVFSSALRLWRSITERNCGRLLLQHWLLQPLNLHLPWWPKGFALTSHPRWGAQFHYPLLLNLLQTNHTGDAPEPSSHLPGPSELNLQAVAKQDTWEKCPPGTRRQWHWCSRDGAGGGWPAVLACLFQG